ncbi:MAG: S9 family peptidase [Gammaproteobacteria bacterium]|nr:S9 family peptidase [Gammaproteobacteria bacterium]
MSQRLLSMLLGLLLMLPAWPARSAPGAAAGVTPGAASITLEQIMANPDWIGNPPARAYWSYNGHHIYYWQKRQGSPLSDLYAVNLANDAVSKVPDSELGTVSAPGGSDNLAHTLRVLVRDDNVFVRDLRSGALRQLTRDAVPKDDAEFMADGERVQWHQGTDIYLYDLRTGMESLAANLQLSEDPAKIKPPQNYLQAEQLRLFEFLSKQQSNSQAADAQQQAQSTADATRMPAPWYLGDQIRIIRSSLSPDGRWLVLITIPASYQRGAPGIMPEWVTPSGYVEMLKRHTYVGLNPPPPQSVMVLDLENHSSFEPDLAQLPGIKDDPLAALRKSAVTWDMKHGIPQKVAEESVKAPAVRLVSVWGLAWSDDGAKLALMFRANDNKDRWIATLDFATKTLVTQNRLTDPAWINWNFNDFGWLHDNHTLWYLSEATNYSQLYLKDVNAKTSRELTGGNFEVSNPTLTRDDRYFYLVANKQAPGIYEIYRVDAHSGDMQAVTDLGGLNGPQPSLEMEGPGGAGYLLSPNERELLVYHSTTLRPPEVWVVNARPHGAATQVTHTVSSAFTSIDWTAPRIVQIPSSHPEVKQPIYARLYVPQTYSPTKSWPAVVFIHGAGYLQDAHQGWSFYFHEMMFASFLTQHGYLVLDMDYRGSAGYGRDWRTAIYQHMGHPEVQDIEDGVHWLEQNRHVDPARLGVWGGSYGGFMTYMMMFRRPDLFAAGAALRPVGDWADYNDFYTGNILNRPAIDPEAYFVSSPINYAGQLKHHLLILQGMEDDNVFFLDSVHMIEKLQELRNPNFDVMIYPTEHHDFKAAYSWLDEYRRIWRLFQTYVNPPAASANNP